MYPGTTSRVLQDVKVTPAPFFTLSFLRRSATTSLRVVRVLYITGTRVNWIGPQRYLHKLGRTSGWHSLAEITLITVGLKIWITQFINASNLVTYKRIYLEDHQILCPYHRGCPDGSLLLIPPSNSGDRPTRDQNQHDQKTKDRTQKTWSEVYLYPRRQALHTNF
jgi:hypothetical protein